MADGTARVFIFSSILLALFAWFQINSKNSPVFLLPFYSSFVFLALATLITLSFDVERHSKNIRSVFYAIIVVATLVIAAAAFSVATFPPGGTRHLFSYQPKDTEVNLEYGSFITGKPGYYGSADQTVFEANYPVGGVFLYYDLYGLRIFTNKSVVSNVTAWFTLSLWPNHSYDILRRPATATDLHNGTESSPSFRDHTFLITWGSTNPSSPEQRVRLNEGYRIAMNVAVKLDGPDYGSLKATIAFSPTESVSGRDEEVSSQLQDGIAIILSGIFLGALLSIPAKRAKQRVIAVLTPTINRANKFISGLWGVKGTPKGFLKACLQCGKEIPIASEQCPLCGAKQQRAR